MARLTIELDMNNAAFEPDPGAEAARILAHLVLRFRQKRDIEDDFELFMLDHNGNRVGTARVTPD